MLKLPVLSEKNYESLHWRLPLRYSARCLQQYATVAVNRTCVCSCQYVFICRNALVVERSVWAFLCTDSNAANSDSQLPHDRTDHMAARVSTARWWRWWWWWWWCSRSSQTTILSTELHLYARTVNQGWNLKYCMQAFSILSWPQIPSFWLKQEARGTPHKNTCMSPLWGWH